MQVTTTPSIRFGTLFGEIYAESARELPAPYKASERTATIQSISIEYRHTDGTPCYLVGFILPEGASMCMVSEALDLLATEWEAHQLSRLDEVEA